jgi:glycosyltransferase involved in cell wall biosynthesis
MSKEMEKDSAPIKVLLLADIGSEHTERWALSLAQRGIHVGLFSFNTAYHPWYEGIKNIELLFEPKQRIGGISFLEKVNYFRYLLPLKKVLKSFKPTVLHAHYASSYGLLGALSGYQPLITSVWGSDVYEFPNQNGLYALFLRFALSRPQLVCSTSHCMRKEAMRFTQQPIKVIPFGIDIERFHRQDAPLPLTNDQQVNIGCIKTIDEKYGTEILINVFYQLQLHFSTKSLRLFLIGDGPQRSKMEKLVRDLKIADKVVFTGRIPHEEIPDWHRKLDVYVSLSTCRESFGVSLVEAMSSGSCIVASDADGFSEVLGEGNRCGYIVSRNSAEEAFQAICQLIASPSNALNQASAARERAVELYNWQRNVDEMLLVYEKQNLKWNEQKKQ